MKVKTKKVLAVVLMVYAIPLLVATTVSYSIFLFIIESINMSRAISEGGMMILRIVDVGLSVVGIIGLLGIPIGIPVGVLLYLSARKQEKREKPAQVPPI